jgi:Zn-dependent protease
VRRSSAATSTFEETAHPADFLTVSMPHPVSIVSPPPIPFAAPPVVGSVTSTTPAIDEEVFAELEKLQQPRKGWVAGVVLFAVSVALFAGAGLIKWNAQFVLILLGILFIHECGHFVAMKLFGYHNVKMFFVPLFGAAVMGTNAHAPGWKKAVVALMGPVPGIVIGIVLTVVTLLTNNVQVGKVALMFLLINGFNLLPLVPLDGGWLLNTVLFGRNRWIEAAFKVVAALLMVLLAFVLGEHWLTFLAVWMLLTTPITFRIGAITGKLRNGGAPLDSGEGHAISRAVAAPIIEEVKVTTPEKVKLKPRDIAALAFNVYEKLHTKQPSLAASVALLMTYFLSIFVTLIVAAVLVVHRGELKPEGDQASVGQQQSADAKPPPPPSEFGDPDSTTEPLP